MMRIRILCTLLCVLLLLPAYGCAKAESVDIAVVENGVAALYIQLPEDAGAQVLYARDRLVFYLRETMGVTPESGTEPKGDHLLVLGNVGDKTCERLQKKLKGNGEFLISATASRITVLADNDAFLYDAVEHLIRAMTSDGSSLRLQGVLDGILPGDKTSLRYLFTQSTVVESESVLHSYVPFHPSGAKGTQGGCVVGNYQYQAFVKSDQQSNELNNITYIGKYDLTTKAMVAYSELLDLNHANDITYNAKTNELVVVHNKPRYKQLSIIDPDTLTLKRTVQLPGSVYSITYNAARDQYMVGRSGGQDIQPVSADFQFLTPSAYPATPTTEHYTTQGICSDDTFIYCVLYDSLRGKTSAGQNVITVYDWYGNYVGTLNFDNGKLEPENISITDGRITVLSYDPKNGGAIHEITPTSPAVPKE